MEHPQDDGVPLADAATGEEVARYSTRALDFAAVVDYARRVGGPALRELTFHERAAALKALGKRLMGAKDQFYPLSFATGATARDSALDVDGGIGYCSATPARQCVNFPTTLFISTGN